MKLPKGVITVHRVAAIDITKPFSDHAVDFLRRILFAEVARYTASGTLA